MIWPLTEAFHTMLSQIYLRDTNTQQRTQQFSTQFSLPEVKYPTCKDFLYNVTTSLDENTINVFLLRHDLGRSHST